MDLFEGIVVSINQSGRVVLQTTDEDGSQLHFVIAKNAKNLVKPKCDHLFFGAVVKVNLIHCDLDVFTSSPFEPKLVGSVVEFSFDDIPTESLIDWNPRIVRVIEAKNPGYVTVAGFSRYGKYFAVNSKPDMKLNQFSLASGYPMRLKPFHYLAPIGQNLWMTKDEEAERKYFCQLRMSYLTPAFSAPIPPLGALTYCNLKALDEPKIMEKLGTTAQVPCRKNRILWQPTPEDVNAEIGLPSKDFKAKEDVRFEDKQLCARIPIIEKPRKPTCRCFKVPCTCDTAMMSHEKTENANPQAPAIDTQFSIFVAEQFDALFDKDCEPLSWNLEPKDVISSLEERMTVLTLTN